ncbi:MAG: hypothetical protein JW940_10745 [Polyangiaceae bacterium]|nr:hypothetical protein [Polyangiaceae bacterium]
MTVPCLASKVPNWLVALWVLACVLSSRAGSGQTNPGAMPLGGRSTLMGGTGVALGRDGASPFLNPATMGRIGDTRLAFSVRFYRYTQSTVDNLVRIPTGGGELHVEDYEQEGISGAPSSFCAFVTLSGLIPEEASGLLRVVRGTSGRTKLGLCGATLERDELGISAEHRRLVTSQATTAANLDFDRAWARSVFGPSVSYQISDTLTVGASMHVVSTDAHDRYGLAVLSESLDGEDRPAVFLDETRASSRDGVTTLGVTYAWRALTAGFSMRLPSIHFSDSARMTRFEQAGTNAPSLRAGSGSYEAPLPVVMSLGTGVDWPGSSVEFDVSTILGGLVAFETDLDELTYSGDASTVRSRNVRSTVGGRSAVAFRAGGEWAVSPSLSVLAGARYEPSRVTPSRDSYGVAPADASVLGTSLGIGSYGRGSELLVGTELSYGWSRLGMTVPTLEGFGRYVARQHSWSALLVLSGSVGLSSVKQTWRNFKELRRPAPSPR